MCQTLYQLQGETLYQLLEEAYSMIGTDNVLSTLRRISVQRIEKLFIEEVAWLLSWVWRIWGALSFQR